MSIADELNHYAGGLEDAYDAVNDMNGVIPANRNMDNLDTAIRTIPQPTVNDGTLTIQKNGTNVATFTANQASNATANISVPTNTSDLNNDSGFITSSSLPGDMTGASSGTAGAHGLVPAPAAGDEGKFLSGAGTWVTVTSGGSYSAGNGISIDANNEISIDTSVVAEVSDIPTNTSDLVNDGADGTSTYVEADELATVATSGLYSDLTGTPTIPTVNDATLTITQNGTSAGTFTANASSNATIALTDTTYSAFTGATSGAAGSAGLVPAPAAGEDDEVLYGDGTWKLPGMTILKYGSSTYAEALAAYQAKNIVYARASSNSNPGTGNQLRMAFLAYVNDETTPTEFEFQYYRSVATHSDSTQGDEVFVYKLNSSGTWSVTKRNAYSKIAAGTNMSSSYSSGTLTLSATDTTYSAFTGTDGITAGTAGLVPAPTTSDVDKYIKSDGTWATPTDTTYTAGTGINISAQNVISSSVADPITDYFISDYLENFSLNASVAIYADEALTTRVSYSELYNAVASGQVRLIYSGQSSDYKAYYLYAEGDNADDYSSAPSEPYYNAIDVATLTVYKIDWSSALWTDPKLTSVLTPGSGSAGTIFYITDTKNSDVPGYSGYYFPQYFRVFKDSAYTDEIGVSDIMDALKNGPANVVINSAMSPLMDYPGQIVSSYGEGGAGYFYMFAQYGSSQTYSKIFRCTTLMNIPGSNTAYLWQSTSQDAMPSIPTVNNGTLTIKHNNTTIQTFTANSSSSKTANIETIYADTIAPVSTVGSITTSNIADAAVTSAKIDWSTVADVNYSLTEHATGGTWVDSKPIYKKTVYIPDTGTGSTVTVAHGISNYSHTIKFEGTLVAPSGQDWPIPQKQTDTGGLIAVRADSTNIYINASNNLTNNASGYVTLWYTKSS